jgi:predicted secreted hydrolase
MGRLTSMIDAGLESPYSRIWEFNLLRTVPVGIRTMAAAILAGWLAGCAVSGAADEPSASYAVEALSAPAAEGFARAYEPVPFVFPDDHGAHPEYQTEWWYFTGNLEDETGDAYGYQLTFFRSALTPEALERESEWATNQVFMAHFAVSDAAAGKHPDFERFSRGAAGLAGASLEPAWSVWLEDWRVETLEPGTYAMTASAVDENGQEVRVDFVLQETRDPVLHGDEGLSQKGPEPGKASYYYSLVGLETTGALTVDGRTVEVRGLSWMDHEYGTSALSGDATGWDWFSVQFDNGAVLMLAQVRTSDGGRIPDFEGTLVMPNDEQHSIGADEFELEALGEWTSPESGATYPSGWRIEVPEHQLLLSLTPLLQDQEMTGGYVYWEGAVDASGSLAGDPVTGRGYVELTGYGGQRGANLR